MADTPTLTLAGYLRVDEDAVTALCERVARTWVERMLDEAGVPAGVFNLVTGSPR